MRTSHYFFSLILGIVFWGAYPLSALSASVYDAVQSTATVGVFQNYEFEYTVDTSVQTWANGDTLSFTIPSNFSLSGLVFTVEYDTDVNNDNTGETQISAGNSNGQYSISGRTVTVKWDTTTWGAVSNGNSTIRILVTSGMIPSFVSTASLTWAGTTANGGDTNPSGTDTIAISVGTLSSVNVEPSSLAVSSLSDHTISFTTNVTLPSGAWILITYPSGWDLSLVNGSTATNLLGLDGTWTASVSGQVITLTQSGGGQSTAGAKSLVLRDIRAPSSTGSGGTYTILTKTSSGSSEIETATASADIVAGAANSSSLSPISNFTVTDAEEGGCLLTWSDPVDDSTYISILKGVSPLPVNGIPYASTLISDEFFIDSSCEKGQTVSYIVRGTDGMDVGTNSEEIIFLVGSTISTEESTETDVVTEEIVEEELVAEDDISTEDVVDEIAASFSDISDHWAEDAIEAMASIHIVQGNPDGTFAPDAALNRAEGATLLWRLVQLNDTISTVTSIPSTHISFQDVSESDWFYIYVSEMNNLGFLEGYTDGYYRPTNGMNRAEFLHLAMAVYAALSSPSESTEVSNYSDVPTYTWYTEDLNLASQLGFVSGESCPDEISSDCFYPSRVITRAEAIQILFKMFQQ